MNKLLIEGAGIVGDGTMGNAPEFLLYQLSSFHIMLNLESSMELAVAEITSLTEGAFMSPFSERM